MSARKPADLRPALLAVALALAAAVPLTRAFDFITDFTGPFPIAWNPGTVPIHIRMPASGPLLDGTTYPTTIEAAVREWNTHLGTIQLAPSILPAADNVSGNGVNEVVMTPTINGATFGTNVLAVALTRVSGTSRAEGDVLFNPIWNWDSYRGPRAANPERFDMRRVALHELGHVLGLDHPDEDTPPQNAVAIMNSRISNTLDALQADDIAGAQALYGAPGFVPANNDFANSTPITADLPVALPGTNVAATKEPGEPAHAGNAGGRSVWWRWTAPATGSAAVTTTGSLFDTLLAIYTGPSAAALVPVASNDNVQGNTVRTSALTFATTAGTTYHIAVDGVAGDAAPLTLNLAFASGGTAPPLIRRQPPSLFTSPGGSVTLAVDATGATAFQWFFNGTAIPGANGSTITLSAADATRAGEYRVQVTNAGGTLTSTTANLQILTTALPDQSVTLGRNVTFTVPNSNNAVQWQVSTNGGASWSNVANDSTFSGATSSQLTLTNATNSHQGLRFRYQLTGEGGLGNVTSAPAALTVAPSVLPQPAAVVPNGSSGYLVADTADDAILAVSATGEVSVFAGARGESGAADGALTSARFNNPSALARAPDGTLFVADRDNHTVRRIANGNVATFAGTAGTRGRTDATGAAAAFAEPSGLALAADGTLFVADTQNHTIRRITAGGAVTTFAGTAGQAGDADGRGTAARFNQPRGLAFDTAGNLHVADTGNNLIRRISPAGDVTTLAGLSGRAGTFDSTTGTGALFNEPTGLTVGADGNLYVTDLNTSFLRRISPSGTVFTLAGLTRTTSIKDGTGRDAWFQQPRAVTADGNALIVADTGNAALRRVTFEGQTTTLPLSASATVVPPPTVPPSTPTPSPAPSGGGGGGGAPSLLFLSLVSAALLARYLRGRC